MEAIRGALAKAGLKVEDIDVRRFFRFLRSLAKPNPSQLFDVNEAFAAQWLSVQKELGLPNDKSNVFGGAIGSSPPSSPGNPLLTSLPSQLSVTLSELRAPGSPPTSCTTSTVSTSVTPSAVRASEEDRGSRSSGSAADFSRFAM